MDDNRCQNIAIGHLSDSGDLKKVYVIDMWYFWLFHQVFNYKRSWSDSDTVRDKKKKSTVVVINYCYRIMIANCQALLTEYLHNTEVSHWARP